LEDGGGSSNLVFVVLALVIAAQVSTTDELQVEFSATGVVFVAVVVFEALQVIADVLGL
jgi:hypothetical protein